jgi:hypothetical protein
MILIEVPDSLVVGGELEEIIYDSFLVEYGIIEDDEVYFHRVSFRKQEDANKFVDRLTHAFASGEDVFVNNKKLSGHVTVWQQQIIWHKTYNQYVYRDGKFYIG